MPRNLVQMTLTALSRLALVAMLAAFAANCQAQSLSGPADLIGSPAPLFTGRTLDGQVVSLEDLRERVVVLDFWATWCPYCKKAMPKVQTVAVRFANEPVTVLGINLDDNATREEIVAFLKECGASFSQVLDPEGHLKKKFGVRGIPCAIVIDKKGIIRSVHVGDTADLAAKLGDGVASLL